MTKQTFFLTLVPSSGQGRRKGGKKEGRKEEKKER